MPTQLDARQSILRNALGFVGSAIGDGVDSILNKIDPELSKLFEDRNVLLTDGGLITFTGTQLQFTEALNLVINSKVAGGVPVVISLGSANVNFTTNLDMWYAVINRTAGTATTTVVANATGLPAVVAANQEVFLIAKRIDAGDGTQRIYWRNGMALNAGQTVRLGASGSGSGGSGVGDDLDALTFRASFNDGFDDGPTSALSAVDVTAAHTDSTAYNAAKAMYVLNYDAGKTIAAATTTTNINISAVAAFTVKTGDMVINNGQARRITAVATQASFTTEAFSVAPTLASQVTISQAVHTKDIYNLALDGNAISAAFPSSTFSEIMVDYEDTSTVGDNIFDIDTVPVVAYTASGDGTSYTAVKVRPTLETDVVQSVTLPAADDGLFLRFFANKSSGSGSINILRYKAFMQKSLTASSGGVINAAYGFLNGVGTEYQATLSVVGNKSTITLTNWTYAVGVSSGSPYGSLDVYINGQLIPRFIDSTVTPDASYLETSPSVITLDKDYSAQALSFEVLQRVQVIDNSNTNVSNISVIQQILGQNVNDFVNMSNLLTSTTVVGTPVAGTFYSTIPGRASMPDLSQDLKARFGPDRVMVQSVQLIRGEVGASGEAVWVSPNDLFGRMRFVGSWYQVNSGGAGQSAFSTTNGDYFEVTFYGTGLNLLDQVDGTARSYAVSVDGGSETVLTVTSPSSVLNNQNYGMNVVRNMVTGLTLGVHTVKIRNNSSLGLTIFGVEMLNTSSTITVNPGVAYVDGAQLTLSSAQNVSHNTSFESGTLGSRGGRVIVYLKADGTIGKAITPTGSQLNTSSADHTNEEVARDIVGREFGAGRNDDWGYLFNARAAAFTLDDDATTLHSATGAEATFVIGDGFNANATSGNFLEFTFIGTGLDILNVRGATLDFNYTINVDGTAIATNVAGSTLFGAGLYNTAKIVSGLPYGSHTVRITNSTTGTVGVGINRFIVYQPKTPTLPAGAIELGRYNLFATYVANATGGQQTIGTGVYRRNVLREAQYQGTWSYNAINNGNIAGRTISTTTNGDSVRYTFFGTGFDFRWASTSVAYQFTLAIDGSSNFTTSNGAFWTGALTTSSYGTGTASFTASTGVVVSNTTPVAGNGVSITGLTLGLHTVVATKSSAAATTFVPEAFDLVVPVHSYKNVSHSTISNILTVGNQSIEDGRKFSLLAEPESFKKAWAQAVGISVSPTTNVASMIPIPDMAVTIKTSGGPISISFSADIVENTAAAAPVFNVMVDGQQVGTTVAYNEMVANEAETITYVCKANVAAGVHVVYILWGVSGGIGTAAGTRRILTVSEE